jgi:methylmalonyl-CoA/ethylmalonyl-CoA epimerase
MNKSGEAGISGIGQIAIRVSDLKAGIDFYQDVLGLKFLMEIPSAAFFDCGGIRLMLTTPEEAEFDHPASIIYYRVGDIQESYRELSRRGVAFVKEPHLLARMPDHELWMAFFRDVSGNMLALMSEVR